MRGQGGAQAEGDVGIPTCIPCCCRLLPPLLLFLLLLCLDPGHPTPPRNAHSCSLEGKGGGEAWVEGADVNLL